MEQYLSFIDGKYQSSSSDWINVFAPAEGSVYGQVVDSNSSDLELAVSAANRAYPTWSTMSIMDRSKLLNRLADLIESNLESLAQAETRDSGKPISTSRAVDIPRAAANFRFFAGAITNFSTEAHLQEAMAVNYTRRSSLGIVACISPWNLPLYLFTWKIAPALAMGNCVIGKPSELTPATATLLGELANQAGIPPGVLNILHGKGAGIGHELVTHKEVKAVSFTGGTSTGKHINQAVAGQFKKVSLELGGKNPVIIFEDADLDLVIPELVRISFSNQGQICLCGSRILIQKSIYQKVVDALVEATTMIKKSSPYEDECRFGALISAQHLDKVSSFVSQAIKEGGQVLTGGATYQVEGQSGYYYEPTILEGLKPDCQINQEEVFGPVITVASFEDEEQALEMANSVVYGLAASIWTSNVTRAHQLAHRLKSGIVWVNCWMHRDLRTPFGGMKSSGLGREGGNEALRFFSEPQNICIKI